jgi:hypothetical protein
MKIQMNLRGIKKVLINRFLLLILFWFIEFFFYFIYLIKDKKIDNSPIRKNI